MRHLVLRVVPLLLLAGIAVIGSPVVLAQGPGDETVTVMAQEATLYAEPAEDAEVLTTLSLEALLIFLGQDESLNWVSVETMDGMIGWVSFSDVRLNGPYLPPENGLTWNAVDGVADDWDRFLLPYEDAIGDSLGEVDIVAARSFINDNFLYGLVQVEGDLENALLVSIDIVTNNEGEYATYQYAVTQRRAGTLIAIDEAGGTARDASAVITAWGDALEFRIPLALLDAPPALNIIAVRVQEMTEAGLVTSDELAQVMPAVVTPELEPMPDMVIVDERVNLRAAPANGAILRVLPPGELLVQLEQSEDGDWFLVRLQDTARGWVSAEYVAPLEDGS